MFFPVVPNSRLEIFFRKNGKPSLRSSNSTPGTHRFTNKHATKSEAKFNLSRFLQSTWFLKIFQKYIPLFYVPHKDTEKKEYIIYVLYPISIMYTEQLTKKCPYIFIVSVTS